jgi:hypothetical protein
MPKCHICGKTGLYMDMIDYTIYSIHHKCEFTLLFTSHNISEFGNCSICHGTASPPTKKELRQHLINNHSKEALADLIVAYAQSRIAN